MKIIRIDKNNQINGFGLRCVIWVSGCENHCPGCHNPETWDYNLGHEWNEEDEKLLKQQMSSPEIDGITLTGGDPMAPLNRKTAKEFCERFKQLYPQKSIWIYTGHRFEEVAHFCKDVDVVVDGPYVESLNPGRGLLKWRGSKNQRIIDVLQSFKQKQIIELKDFNGKTFSENEERDGI